MREGVTTFETLCGYLHSNTYIDLNTHIHDTYTDFTMRMLPALVHCVHWMRLSTLNRGSQLPGLMDTCKRARKDRYTFMATHRV